MTISRDHMVNDHLQFLFGAYHGSYDFMVIIIILSFKQKYLHHVLSF